MTSSAPCPWPRAGSGSCSPRSPATWTGPCKRRLGHDLGKDPAPDVNGAGVFLGDARLSAAALAGDLSQAQEQLAYVNGRPARRTSKDQA